MRVDLRRFRVQLDAVRLFFLVGLVWASMVGPYSSVLILKSIGATSPQIGIFVAISAVIGMLTQPMWGVISDKLGSPRRIFCICLAISSTLFGSVMLIENFYAAACLLFVDNFFRCCIISLMDSHTISEANTIPGLRYGYIRVAGSVFFGLVSFGYSGLISASGMKAIIPVSVCISAVAVMYGLFFAKGRWEKQADKNSGHIKKKKANFKEDATDLFKNRIFVVLILFTAFNAMATSPSYTFMIDFISAVGGSAGDVPMIHALKCVFEVPLMLFAGAFAQRIDSRKLILAGIIFSFIQLLGLIFANSSLLVVLFFFLGTPGFVLCMNGKLQYLRDITPDSVRSTSFTVMSAAEVGLGSIAGNLLGGFIAGRYGVRSLALIEVAILCIALILLLYILKAPAGGRRMNGGEAY